jgi:hypothetical protein
MKRKSKSFRPMLPVAALGILSVGAQTFTPTRVVPVPPESANKLSASFRMAFNVKTSFENVGVAPNRTTDNGDAWNYDDGYVLVDSTGNAMGYTRYWGYTSLGQLPGDGTLLMHRQSGGSVGADADEPLPGFELTYRRELGRGEKFRWGIEAAGNYMRVNTRSSGTISYNASRLTDTYALPALEGGGYVSPPPPPYSQGPDLPPGGSIVIGADPLSSIVDSVASSVSGYHDFEANVIGWRLGPYVEMPLGQRGRLSLSGGLSLAYVLSDYDFSESLTSPVVASVSGGGSDSDVLVGAYISGEAAYQIGQAWEVFGNVQFQYLDKYSHTENNRTAVLDMTQSLFVSVGVSYSF